jgi:site-specific recombinase XerD
VHAFIQRPLIPLLEEYYLYYRKHLVSEIASGTLFLNEIGNKISRNKMSNVVGELTLRHAGKHITPHTFRQ